MKLHIRHTAAAVLAIGAASLVLAACGGGDSNNGNASTMDAGTGLVSVRSVDNTKVLTDAQGRTLYSANIEKGGQVMCTSGCTSIWKPLDASSSQAKSAAGDLNLDLGVVKRPGGTDQLTFHGKPLYSFTQEGAGQLKGNGVVDNFDGTKFTWSAAATGGANASSSPSNSSYY